MRRFSQNKIRAIVAGVSEDFNKQCKVTIKKAASDIFYNPSTIDESCLKTHASLLDVQSKNSLNHIIESPINSQLTECTMCSSMKKANDDLNQQMFQISVERQQMINHNIETQQLLQKKDEEIFQLNLKLHGLEGVHHKCVELQEINQKLMDESEKIQGLNKVYRESITQLTDQKMKLAEKAAIVESIQKELNYEQDIRKQLDKDIIKAKADLYEVSNKFEQAKDHIKVLSQKIQSLEEEMLRKDLTIQDYNQIKYQNQCLQLQKQGDRIRLDQQNEIIVQLQGKQLQQVDTEIQTSPLLQNYADQLSIDVLKNDSSKLKIPKPEKKISTPLIESQTYNQHIQEKLEEVEEAEEMEDKNHEIQTLFAIKQNSSSPDSRNNIDLQPNLVQSFKQHIVPKEKQIVHQEYAPKQLTESQNKKFIQIMANSNYQTLNSSIDENPQSLSAVLDNCDKVMEQKALHDKKQQETKENTQLNIELSIQQNSVCSSNQVPSVVDKMPATQSTQSLENSKTNQQIVKSDTATNTSDIMEQIKQSNEQVSQDTQLSSISMQQNMSENEIVQNSVQQMSSNE